MRFRRLRDHPVSQMIIWCIRSKLFNMVCRLSWSAISTNSILGTSWFANLNDTISEIISPANDVNLGITGKPS